MSNTYMDFWGAVKAAMDYRGMSEADLGSSLGLRWLAAQDWKRGEPPERASVVRFVGAILGCRFFEGEDGWIVEYTE